MTYPTPEVHLGPRPLDEPELPLATNGVLRVVWHSRFGDMLIEVREGQAFVNGSAVVPAIDATPKSIV